MNCKFDEFLLHEYIDGTIDPLEKIILEEHLKTCPSCRRVLTELKLLMWELEPLGEIEVPEEVSTVRHEVLNQLIDNKTADSFDIKRFLHLQRNILETSGSFIDLIPGVKSGLGAVESGIKKTPSVLYKAAGMIAKARKKPLIVRGRL